MAKEKKKIELNVILEKIKKKYSKLSISTWYVTITFYLIVFVASLWIWWSCYYSPKPSNNVVLEFESKKEDFHSMRNKTEDAISLLRKKRDNFYNVPDMSGQRELFMEKEEEEVEEEEHSIEPIVAPQPEIGEEEDNQPSNPIVVPPPESPGAQDSENPQPVQ